MQPSDPSRPRDRSGRFDARRLARPCARCSHPLGEHAAGSGRSGAPRACLAEGCPCHDFALSASALDN